MDFSLHVFFIALCCLKCLTHLSNLVQRACVKGGQSRSLNFLWVGNLLWQDTSNSKARDISWSFLWVFLSQLRTNNLLLGFWMDFFPTQKYSPFPLMTDQKLQTLECACYSIFELLQSLKKMYLSFSTIFIHTIDWWWWVQWITNNLLSRKCS